MKIIKENDYHYRGFTYHTIDIESENKIVRAFITPVFSSYLEENDEEKQRHVLACDLIDFIHDSKRLLTKEYFYTKQEGVNIIMNGLNALKQT